LSKRISSSNTHTSCCTDGQDNDQNGFVDCNDFSCTDSTRGATPEAIARCDQVTERSPSNCSDGIDNDQNGFIDCRDNGCRFNSDPAVKSLCQESADPALCEDGLDNDGDGFVEENLWTGIGRARSGCGAAIVGTPDQVLAKLCAYQAEGIEAFILSGYPHMQEADMFARHVLPHIAHGPL
jgi:hypothetical protein